MNAASSLVAPVTDTRRATASASAAAVVMLLAVCAACRVGALCQCSRAAGVLLGLLFVVDRCTGCCEGPSWRREREHRSGRLVGWDGRGHTKLL